MKNASDEVKEHLQNVRTRIEASAKIKMELKEKKQGLLDKVKAGDEGAKAELDKLQEERKEKLKTVRKEFKAKREAAVDKAKEMRDDEKEVMKEKWKKRVEKEG